MQFWSADVSTVLEPFLKHDIQGNKGKGAFGGKTATEFRRKGTVFQKTFRRNIPNTYINTDRFITPASEIQAFILQKLCAKYISCYSIYKCIDITD
jgi:hypothetical protein